MNNVDYFTHILLQNIFPLGMMIALGVILQRAFHLDIKTLSKLNFYLFSPAIILKMLYESDISVSILFKVVIYFALLFAASYLMVEIVIRIKGYRNSMKSAMRNSVLFYNSGNYAMPLNLLVFSANPLALSVQLVIMMMQNLVPNTYGIYNVNAHQKPLKETMKTIFSMPVIYAIPLAFVLRGFHIPIPHPVYIPLTYIANGFLAVALLTLGVQLGSMKWVLKFSDVLVSNVLRLCAAPLLAFLIVLVMGFKGLTAQALILSSAVPTSLSSMLLAVEFDNEPEFASQAVFSSTLFSIFTVTGVIYLLQYVV